MKRIWIIFVALFMTGCAVGNKYSYQTSDMALPIKASENKTVVLLVNDLRPYILSGDKAPNFVGLQRGGFGNPFDVTTTSGQAMTKDMSIAIADGLEETGYHVINVEEKADINHLISTAVNQGASRIIVLEVHDWKSDIYMSLTLHCDLKLSVYNADGTQLAENSSSFVRAIGGAQIGASKNSEIVADEFAKQIGYLFNEESIRGALE